MVVWSQQQQQQQQYRLSCCASMNVAMWQIWFLSSSNTYQKYSPIMISHIFFANHSSIHPWFFAPLSSSHSLILFNRYVDHTHTHTNKQEKNMKWNETKRNDRHWEWRKSPKFFLLILQQQIIVIIIIINDFGLRINFLFPFIHSFILLCVCVHFLRKNKTYKYTHSTSLKKEYLHIYDRLQGVIYLFISIFFGFKFLCLNFSSSNLACCCCCCHSFFHFSNIKYHYY